MCPDDPDTRTSGPSPQDRRRRVAVAGHSGDAAGARAGLEDPEPAVRGSALGALARLGVLDEADLRRGLTDPDPGVRRRAALEAARSDLALGPLVTLLADEDAPVVEAAAFACGERPDCDSGAVAELARVATGHPDALCREAAVAALGSLGRPGGREAVLAACSDRATVRRRAVLALAAFEGQEVTDALRRLCGDRDLQVRQAAEELLAIEEGGEW